MHNALLIPELRSHILDYLVADTGDCPRRSETRPGPGQQALAALARTCRALSEPALDALWHELHTLKPLLRCSRAEGPDDVETEDDDDIPLPPFNEEEWNVIIRYAPRVRELSVFDWDELSAKILESLWFRTTLLLPNLRKLFWNSHNQTNFPLIRLVLGPSLRHLYVWLAHPNRSSILGFLECYHAFCPNLKSLHFGYVFQDSGSLAVTVISRAVCRLPDLVSLICDDLTEEAFLRIATSRNLKQLSARLVNQHPEDLRRLASHCTPDSPPFQNLRVLHLCIKDCSAIIPYLKSQHQPFEEISLEFSEVSAPEVLHELFIALGSPTRRKTLRRMILGVDTISSRLRRSNASQVTFDILSPLLGFNLHEFEVNLHNPISLNDDALGRLVQGWPDLETFKINAYSGWRTPHYPTLKGLLRVLAQCPKLRRFVLCVDARTIPSLTEDESKICNMRIRRLDVMDSPIKRPLMADVSRFLLEHAPSLVRIYSYSITSHKYQRIWEEVDMHIKGIKGLDYPRFGTGSDIEY